MVKVFQGTEDEYYMDGYLQSNLDIAKGAVKEDWDMVIAVDGYEGSGKSVLTQQCAKYCDPTFDISRIVFTPEEFEKAVIDAKPFQAIVYDEAYTGLSSRATMSGINQALVRMLAEIRQKKLFIFVVMPTFFDLDKYVALWRSKALIHIYDKGFKRGYFCFFSRDKKKKLYVIGKKFYNYGVTKSDFIGRFTNHYTVDEAKYREKKRTSLHKKREIKISREVRHQFEKEIIAHLLDLEKLGEINRMFISKVLNISHPTVLARINEIEKMKM